MTDEEFMAEYNAAETQFKNAKLALRIKDIGPCPKWKGHGDARSFWAGIVCGVCLAVIWVIAVHFLR